MLRVVVFSCVWQMALASDPGTSHATLTSPSCLPHDHAVCFTLPLGCDFPEGFAAFSFLLLSPSLRGRRSPALLLRKGQKRVAVHDIL